MMGSSVGSQFLYEKPAGMPARWASAAVALGGADLLEDFFGVAGVGVGCDRVE